MYELMCGLLFMYVVVSVWIGFRKMKSDILLREVLDAVVEENELLAKQNKMLREVFKKYNFEIPD